MAKLMAPNIRIDWYPEGHFADPENPTLGELNSGYNLSPAIVTGFTLDFTDTNTVDAATIYDKQTSELFTHSSYEANLQFFLAPRLSNAANEAAYRMAEELFYHNQFAKGYLVKRFGYKWNVDYQIGQKIDIFYFQATTPKVVAEEGNPILLEVTYIPLGLGVSRGWAGQIKFSWLGEPHNSPSIKTFDGVEVARNVMPSPRGRNLSVWVRGASYSAHHDAIQLGPSWGAVPYCTLPGMVNQEYAGLRMEIIALDGGNEITIAMYRGGATHEYRTLKAGDSTVWSASNFVNNNIFIAAPNAEGVTAHVRISVAVGSNEQEALRQVETYFDGDSIYNG